MPEKAWKGAERKVARDLGGERTPLSGSNSRHTSADGIGLEEYLEHKRRKRDPVHERLSELTRAARRRDRRPIIYYELDNDEGPVARWAAMWLDRYLELRAMNGGQPLSLQNEGPLEEGPGRPWLVVHEVGRRLPHGQLVRDTCREADREGRWPLVVISRHRSPNRVALVPLRVCR